ncbi:cysteine hydrolase family protein [Dactylosporangium sucinum]|uniref:Hydrolase n=1 Tax=Dactylosporangium sucinum TaxID=1424081 RepID=A0A917T531_9ACTN|nr:isochorismatase family protein [Dactylosporangium sucinum]GGM09365.1 hydrolase [Dactylosporangium sucinum]
MRSALIVIDIQESFRQRPSWAACSNPGIVDAVNPLIDDARRRGDLVVWVLHHEPGTGNVFDPDAGHDYVRFMDGLSPLAGEPVLAKTSANAFTTTGLAQLLTTEGVRHLIVTGIQTELCCETTTRVAGDLGYEVTYVTEATATFPIAHRDDRGRPYEEILASPRTLSTADIIARTEYALDGRFATVATIKEVLAR